MLFPNFLTIKNYILSHSGLLNIAIKKNKNDFIKIILFDVFSVVASAGVIGTVSLYISSVQKNITLNMLGVSIELKADIYYLIVACMIILFLRLFSAWARYNSAILSREIGRTVHACSTISTIESLKKYRCMSKGSFKVEPSHAIKQMTTNPVQMGIASETIIRMISPLLFVLIGIVFALAIDFYLTVMIIPFAILGFPIVYKLSKGVHDDAKIFYQQRAQEYGKNLANLIHNMNASSDLMDEKKSADEIYYANAISRQFLNGFDRNQLANDKFIFSTSIIQSCFLVAVVFSFGYYAIIGDKLWGEMLAFVMAIYYVINNSQSILSNLTNLNRFYPQMNDYAKFKENISVSCEENGDSTKKNEVVLTSKMKIPNSLTSLEVQPGDVVFYSNPICTMSRFDFHHISKPLLNASNLSKYDLYCSGFITTRYNALLGKLKDYLFFSGENSIYREKINSLLIELNLKQELQKIPNAEEMEMESVWNLISNPLKSLIKLIPSFFSKQQIVFIEKAVLDCLSSVQKEIIFGCYKKKIVFIIFNGKLLQKLVNERHILVCDEMEVLGIGNYNWYSENAKSISKLCDDSKSDNVAENNDMLDLTLL